MSILLKPYEISLWNDVWDGSKNKYSEKRVATIGSDKMHSQSRAQEPKLVRKVNGEISFSFVMYYEYIDNITGEKTSNPFVPLLGNESKIKLHYDGQWFDLLIKTINKDSSKKTVTYTLCDEHINELSKNGYNVTLDAALMNNMGTAKQLGERVMTGTEWAVDSEILIQTFEEALVVLKVGTELKKAIPLTETETEGIVIGDIISIPSGAIIYGFYSCCSGDNPSRFQFMYKEDNNFITNDKRIIQDKNCQYYIEPQIYTTVDSVGLSIPEGLALAKDDNNIKSNISEKYRANRYLFTSDVSYHPGLDRYVQKFTYSVANEGTKECYGFENKSVFVKDLQNNYFANNNFIGTEEWQVFQRDGSPAQGNPLSAIGVKKDESVNNPFGKSQLHCSFEAEGILVNNGPYSKRSSIKGFYAGEPYTLNFEGYSKAETQISIQLVKVTSNKFDRDNSLFSYTESEATTNHKIKVDLGAKFSISQEDYLKNRYVLIISSSEEAELTIVNCSFCKKQQNVIEQNNIGIASEWKYFDINTDKDATESEITFLPNSIKEDFIYSNNCEKITSISINKSNYFNAIQSIAEKFECWPEIKVEHDEEGYIIDGSKTIIFRRYVGQPNYVGFRYGLNEKDIKRTYDSKQIVTKLIVLANSNQFGKDGFCSINRASSNVIADNVLFDFGYYVNQGMISNPEDLQEDLYLIKESADLQAFQSLQSCPDVQTLESLDGYKNLDSSGYYLKLRYLNIRMMELAELIAQRAIAEAEANASANVKKVGEVAASQQLQQAETSFYQIAGFTYDHYRGSATDEEKEKVEKSSILSKYVEEIETAWSSLAYYWDQPGNEVSDVNSSYTALNNLYDVQVKLKEKVNQEFYKKYSRFLQEGTWIDESYVDDNLYYNDAQSVLYNSSMPQVQYTINVIALDGLPEYQNITFKIGDQTFVEDPEFFGYNIDGTPYREEIVITEISEVLEDPSKNTIKVQNYENQFQDLFQRITATVQSIQYSEGSYKKAAALVGADAAYKLSFLSDALNDAENILSNAGDQTVVLDKEGLTITDSIHPSQALRAVGGAILLKGTAADGTEKWTTGITANGISANLITSGQVNTGIIQIMNGDQPTFRWDTHGITAYSFDNSVSNTYLSGIDTTKGIRFDRFGIYGYTGVDGETWYPSSISGSMNEGEMNIEEASTFYLTWEGLKVGTKKSGKENSLKREQTTLRIGDNAKTNTENAETDTENDSSIFRVDKTTWERQTEESEYEETTKTTFEISADGFMKAEGGEFRGTIYAEDGEFTGAINATSLTLAPSIQIDYDQNISNKPTIPESVEDLGFDSKNVIYKGDISMTSQYDDEGRQYTSITVPTVNGESVTYDSYNTDEYLVFGRAQGEDSQDKKTSYFCVSKEGLLEANNAVIWGKIYATEGEFSGTLKAAKGTFEGTITSKSGKMGPWYFNEEEGIHNWDSGYYAQLFPTSLTLGTDFESAVSLSYNSLTFSGQGHPATYSANAVFAEDHVLTWKRFFEWDQSVGDHLLPDGILKDFGTRIRNLENSEGGGGGGGISQDDFEDLVQRVNNLESQHSVSVNVVSEASCTEPEYSALVCDSCGEIGERYESGDPTEHKFDSKVVSAKTIYASATCSRGPLYYYSCSDCNAVSTDSSQTFEDTNGNRLPHTIVNGIKPGTGRVNNGKHQHQSGAYCANCDHEEYLTYVDATQDEFSNGVCNSCQWSCNDYGHNWSNWEKISDFKWTRKCQICGKLEITTYPPIQN